MTRLYVYVHCEECGEAYATNFGTYFGKRLGDKPIIEGLCLRCEIEKMMEPEGDGNDA